MGQIKTLNGLEIVDEQARNLLQSYIDIIHPVGSFYFSKSNTNPSDIFGGVWKQVKDVFLLGAGDTYNVGDIGGEATHLLTVDEMPEHAHQTGKTNDSGKYASEVSQSAVILFDNMSGEIPSEAVGGSKPHNNMPPYLAVYIWERIA